MKINRNILALLSVVLVMAFVSCKTGKDDKIKKPPQDNFRITFHQAIQEKMRDNYDVAAELFEKCLTYRPENDAVHYALSDVYQELGESEKSLNHALQAYELDKENRWYQVRLAKMYFDRGNYHKSAEFYAISIEQERNLDVKFKYAEALIYSHQYKKAIAILDEIEVETGLSPSLSLTKHDMYLQLGDEEAAKQELDHLINDNPSNIENRLVVADYFLRTNQVKAAEEVVQEALKIEPHNGEARLIMADISIRRGDLKACFEHLDKGFRAEDVSMSRKVALIGNLQQYAFEDNDDARQIRDGLENLYQIIYSDEIKNDTLHAQYAQFLQAQHKPLEAIEQFKKVVDINPNSYDNWMQLLYSQLNIKDYEGMYETGLEVVALFPSQPTVFLLAGMAATESGKHEDAEEWLYYGKEIVVNDPGLSAEFLHQLGILSWRQKDFEQAHIYFDQAKQKDPYNGNVYESKALCYVDQSEEDLALKEVESALSQAPTNAFFHDVKGLVYFRLGNYEKSKQALENALVYEEKNPKILEHYGDVLFKLGEKEEALKQWQKAKDNGGYNDILNKKLKDKTYYEQ
ncbi:MAG: tetratricopeptide repeat protein [Crocinitomicaceae bacterium]|nr:tetratricopeptide repeat protein [Crocinitomicaceae bacterium]